MLQKCLSHSLNINSWSETNVSFMPSNNSVWLSLHLTASRLFCWENVFKRQRVKVSNQIYHSHTERPYANPIKHLVEGARLKTVFLCGDSSQTCTTASSSERTASSICAWTLISFTVYWNTEYVALTVPGWACWRSRQCSPGPCLRNPHGQGSTSWPGWWGTPAATLRPPRACPGATEE